jgi:glutaredoxin 3
MKNVIVYSTPTCHFCGITKEFLTKHGIAYIEKDVSNDQEAAREMIDKSDQTSVPVVVISENGGEEELIIGFDKDRLLAALGITR